MIIFDHDEAPANVVRALLDKQLSELERARDILFSIVSGNEKAEIALNDEIRAQVAIIERVRRRISDMEDLWFKQGEKK